MPVLLTVWLSLPLAAGAQPSTGGCVQAECHAEITRRPFVHEPVRKAECAPCHVAKKNGGPVPAYHRNTTLRELAEPAGGEVCGECHQPLPPLHDSGQGSGLDPCLRCHDPHGGATAAELRAPEGELCLACHVREFERPPPRRRPADGDQDEDEDETQVYAHGPVQERRCDPCHTAHGQGASGLVRGNLPSGLYSRYSRSAYSACYGSCHEPELAEAARTTEATRFRNGDDNLHYRHVVAPSRGRSCRFCHEPHRARNRAQILEGMPFGRERLTLSFTATERGGRCTTTCHIPLEYDRQKAIPSPMRVREWPPRTEAQ